MDHYIDTYVLLFNDNSLCVAANTNIVSLPEKGYRIIYTSDDNLYSSKQSILVGEVESRSLDEYGLYVSIRLYDIPHAKNIFNPKFWQELFKNKFISFTCSGYYDDKIEGVASSVILNNIHINMIPSKPKELCNV